MATAFQLNTTLQVTAPDEDMEVLSEVSQMDHDETYDLDVTASGNLDQEGDYILEDHVPEQGGDGYERGTTNDDEMLYETEHQDDTLIDDMDDTLYDAHPEQDEIFDDAGEVNLEIDVHDVTDQTVTLGNGHDETFLTAFEEPVQEDYEDLDRTVNADIAHSGAASPEEPGLQDQNAALTAASDEMQAPGLAHTGIITDLDFAAEHGETPQTFPSVHQESLLALPTAEVDEALKQPDLSTVISQVDALADSSTSDFAEQDSATTYHRSHPSRIAKHQATEGYASVDQADSSASLDAQDPVGEAVYLEEGAAGPVAQKLGAQVDDNLEESDQPEVPTILVKYFEDEFSLFPPATQYSNLTQYSNYDYLLNDVRFFHETLGNLLAECRQMLGDVSEEQELEVNIPALGLNISEENSECAKCSIEQIATVFHTLNANDGDEDMQPLRMYLNVKTKFSARLASLQQAVNEQRGISQLDFLDTPDNLSLGEDDEEFEQIDGGNAEDAVSYDDVDQQGDEPEYERQLEDSAGSKEAEGTAIDESKAGFDVDGDPAAQKFATDNHLTAPTQADPTEILDDPEKIEENATSSIDVFRKTASQDGFSDFNAALSNSNNAINQDVEKHDDDVSSGSSTLQGEHELNSGMQQFPDFSETTDSQLLEGNRDESDNVEDHQVEVQSVEAHATEGPMGAVSDADHGSDFPLTSAEEKALEPGQFQEPQENWNDSVHYGDDDNFAEHNIEYTNQEQDLDTDFEQSEETTGGEHKPDNLPAASEEHHGSTGILDGGFKDYFSSLENTAEVRLDEDDITYEGEHDDDDDNSAAAAITIDTRSKEALETMDQATDIHSEQSAGKKRNRDDGGLDDKHQLSPKRTRV